MVMRIVVAVVELLGPPPMNHETVEQPILPGFS